MGHRKRLALCSGRQRRRGQALACPQPQLLVRAHAPQPGQCRGVEKDQGQGRKLLRLAGGSKGQARRSAASPLRFPITSPCTLSSPGLDGGGRLPRHAALHHLTLTGKASGTTAASRTPSACSRTRSPAPRQIGQAYATAGPLACINLESAPFGYKKLIFSLDTRAPPAP